MPVSRGADGEGKAVPLPSCMFRGSYLVLNDSHYVTKSHQWISQGVPGCQEIFRTRGEAASSAVRPGDGGDRAAADLLVRVRLQCPSCPLLRASCTGFFRLPGKREADGISGSPII